ncbi:MAG: hypothetical protein WC461_00895 [Candidatus Paceibacterota bacterium]
MKTTRFFLTVLLIAFLAITTGCASFNAAGKMPDFNNPSSTDRARLSTKIGTDASITICPVKEKEEAEKYFDEDFISAGILAVAVHADCSVETTLVAATLIPKSGVPVSSMDSKEIYAVMKRGYGARTVAGWFFGLYIGAPILAYQTYKTNERIQQDLDGAEGTTGKLLKVGNFPKGNTEGFLCFKVNDPTTVKGTLKLVFQRSGKLAEYNLDVN